MNRTFLESGFVVTIRDESMDSQNESMFLRISYTIPASLVFTICPTLPKLTYPLFQFFKSQLKEDGPGAAVCCSSTETLKALLNFCQHKSPKPMYFQQMTFPIQDLAFKRPMKCIYNGREVTLYQNKNGTVEDLVYLPQIFLCF
jgi:hypothetical protein